jgi:hypothetical protein
MTIAENVTESLHFDRGTIFKHEDTPEGFLRLHMTIAKVGELKYFNKDGSDRLEVVTPEVLFDSKSIDSFKMKPITSPNHPPVMLNADNAGAYSKGMTGNLVTIDGDFLGIVATVTDSETIRGIKSGRTKQVSCGYMAGTRQRSDGKFDQVYRLGNHVTICEQGRAGADVRVNVDSVEGEQLEVFVSEPIHNDELDMTTTTINPTAPTLETLTLKLDEFESINVPLAYAKPISDKFKRDADAVGSAKAKIASLEAELTKAKADLADMTKDKTDSISQLDSLQAALKATGFDSIEALAKEKDTQAARADQLADEVKQLKETPAKPALDSAELMTLVKARRELERKCDGLLPKDFNIDEANDRTLREAVILNKSSLTTLDGRNDAYVEARFDAIVEAHENRDTTAPLAASARQAASTPPKTEQRADTTAWLEMVQAMTNPTAATAS